MAALEDCNPDLRRGVLIGVDLGDADSCAHIQELQDRLQVPLYHSALRPANVSAHLQKRRIQLLREQLPYPWTHVGTPSHLGHMDRVAATMPSQAHAGAAQEAPDIGQWEGQDVPLVRPSSCNVKGGIPSSRRYLPTYLPFLTRVARWLARKHIHVPDEHTRCPCDHTTPEDWEHLKKCPLHTDRDTLVGWSPAETLRQHEGWPTHSHAHQANEHLFRDPLIKEATMRGAVTQALHRHLTKHTESPQHPGGNAGMHRAKNTRKAPWRQQHTSS